MMLIKIRERGAVPRKLVSATNRAMKAAYYDTGVRFHSEYRDRRFNRSHAITAGYEPRKGEGMAPGSKFWRRSYTGQKFAKFGHTNPLQFTGETRAAVRTANISSTSRGAQVAYPGARKLNFRHPRSKVFAAIEFRTLTQREIMELGSYFDKRLNIEKEAAGLL